jgi:mRNA interferase YafQ
VIRIFYDSSFLRAVKKFVKNNSLLKKRIYEAIELLEKDPFAPELHTHRLTGNLFGMLSCSCGYNCRIIFSIEKKSDSDELVITLMNIGTHDDVY